MSQFMIWLDQAERNHPDFNVLIVPHRFLQLPCGCVREAVAAPTRRGSKAVVEFRLNLRLDQYGRILGWQHCSCEKLVGDSVYIGAKPNERWFNRDLQLLVPSVSSVGARIERGPYFVN